MNDKQHPRGAANKNQSILRRICQIFWGMDIPKSRLFWAHKATRALTHSHRKVKGDHHLKFRDGIVEHQVN